MVTTFFSIYYKYKCEIFSIETEIEITQKHAYHIPQWNLMPNVLRLSSLFLVVSSDGDFAFFLFISLNNLSNISQYLATFAFLYSLMY